MNSRAPGVGDGERTKTYGMASTGFDLPLLPRIFDIFWIHMYVLLCSTAVRS